MIYKILLVQLAALLILSGCSNNKKEDNIKTTTITAPEKITTDSNVMKVYVTGTGTITANGKQTTLSELDSSFSRLKKNKGTVYYSRDNNQKDPSPEAMKVIELVVKHELPISLFTDKTFSVIVKPEE